MRKKTQVSRRVRSPVHFSRNFNLSGSYVVGRFYDMGNQKDNNSVVHSLFVAKPVLPTDYVLGTCISISGVCRYYHVYPVGTTNIVGLLFVSAVHCTIVTPYFLSASQYGGDHKPKSFDSHFELEKLGLLYYVSNDGSVLAVTGSADSRMLVRAD